MTSTRITFPFINGTLADINQESVLFEISITENIQCGKDGAIDKQVDNNK